MSDNYNLETAKVQPEFKFGATIAAIVYQEEIDLIEVNNRNLTSITASAPIGTNPRRISFAVDRAVLKTQRKIRNLKEKIR